MAAPFTKTETRARRPYLEASSRHRSGFGAASDRCTVTLRLSAIVVISESFFLALRLLDASHRGKGEEKVAIASEKKQG